MYSSADVGEIVFARTAANAVATGLSGKADNVAKRASNVVVGTSENTIAEFDVVRRLQTRLRLFSASEEAVLLAAGGGEAGQVLLRVQGFAMSSSGEDVFFFVVAHACCVELSDGASFGKTLLCLANNSPVSLFQVKSSIVLSGLVLSSRLFAYKRSGSHFHFCPRPCSRHLSMGQAATPHRHGTTSHFSPCSDASFGRVSNACVSSPKDWAVSISSHMQEDMVISLARFHARTVPCQNLDSQNCCNLV